MNNSTASLEVYHALVRAGVKNDEADNLAKTIISRAEVEDTLPSKQDLQLLREELRDELSTTTRWLISVFIGIAFGQVALTITIVGLMFNFYLG